MGLRHTQIETFADNVGLTKTVTFDFTPAVGETLILALSQSATATTPTGWTLLDAAVPGGAYYVFSKVSDGTEVDVSWTQNGDRTCVAIVAVLTEGARVFGVGPANEANFLYVSDVTSDTGTVSAATHGATVPAGTFLRFNLQNGPDMIEGSLNLAPGAGSDLVEQVESSIGGVAFTEDAWGALYSYEYTANETIVSFDNTNFTPTGYYALTLFAEYIGGTDQPLAAHEETAAVTSHTITFDQPTTAGREVFVVGECAAVVSLPAGGWVFDKTFTGAVHQFVLRLPGASNPGGLTGLTLSTPQARRLTAVAWETDRAGGAPTYGDANDEGANDGFNSGNPSLPVSAGTLWGTGLHTFASGYGVAVLWHGQSSTNPDASQVVSVDQGTLIGSAHSPFGGVGDEGGIIAVAVTGQMVNNGVSATLSPALEPHGFGGDPQENNGFLAYDLVPVNDTTPPVLQSRSPAVDATDVSVGAAITATFNEALGGTPTISLSPAVAGSLSNAGGALGFTPDAPLAESTTYTVTVSGIEDTSGNTLADISWSFTTGLADTTPPALQSRTPAMDATSVAVNTTITLTFDEPLGGTPSVVLSPAAAGTLDNTAGVLTFTPDADLDNDTLYTVTASGLEDTSGNTLADISWSFTTVAVGGIVWGSTIAEEIALPGEDLAWVTGIVGAGSVDAQGFTDKMSYNVGETVQFAIHSATSVVQVDIYRIGGYDTGWRKVGQIVNTPTVQPASQTIPNSGEGADLATECSNWSVTAAWTIPAEAWSGMYVAMPRVTDPANNSGFIPFVVRQDARTADLVVKTSDTTWGAAYNDFNTAASPFNGASLYGSGADGLSPRAYAVSFDRPIVTRQDYIQTYWMACEAPLFRFLDKQGVDWKLISSLDLDAGLTAVGNAKALASVGHDEYWSQGMWDNAVAFRDAGGHLIFMSGNEVFWRVRFSPDRRTMWCYKDTMNNGVPLDPVEWTGTWRDTRWVDRTPENLLTGTFFRMNGVNDRTIVVDAATYGSSPFWRNTTVETGTDLTLVGCLGFEADEYVPTQEAQILLAATTVNIDGYYADDNGQYYGNNGDLVWGIQAQRFGADSMVIGFGTTQWSWALDAVHDRGTNVENVQAKQATINLLTDMGVEVATPTAGLVVTAPASLYDYGLSAVRQAVAIRVSDGVSWWEVPVVNAPEDISAVRNVQGVTGIWRGTASQYAALGTKDPNVMYVTKD